MVNNFIMLLICLFLFTYMRTSTSLDRLASTQSIQDGETLVSASGTYELGFFSPGDSKSRYLGIWCRNIIPLTVVWVANQEKPLQNIPRGVLQFNEKGVLLLLNGTNSTVWSSNISSKFLGWDNSIAQLLDSGNLVVKTGRDNKEDHLLWQSFDYPSDTLLPGMKLGLLTGLDRFLSSWKSVDDPAEGEYSLRIDRRGYPQIVLFKGSIPKFRGGSWNGLAFTGHPTEKSGPKYRTEFVLNEKDAYFEFELLDSSFDCMYRLTPSGIGQRLVWTRQTRRANVVTAEAADQCEEYASCGGNSICNIENNSPTCECVKGYVPKNPDHWNISYWSEGCVRKNTLDCNNKDGFWRYTNMKLPDTSSSRFDKTMNLEECKTSCLKNCNCTSYANLDIRNGGSGCLFWYGDLIDMRQFSQVGQDLYIRVPASELDSNTRKNWQRKLLIIGIAMAFAALFTLGLFVYYYKRRRLRGKGEDLLLFDVGMSMKVDSSEDSEAGKVAKANKREVKLPLFSFASVSAATDNFSAENKLGEGGFGPVYKGKLLNGNEVAIKRLSKRSSQGWEELKNEALLIAKLQHNNLVRLLGCCIEQDEKMLIYEFMANKSLDFTLFDATKSRILNWETRVRIIDGIVQGLLYLHQYSRFRIIHRDLKASNILLDINMNPKISDFGLARMFSENDLQANTRRIVGTYGYMSPEYALEGLFSIKSDVFSFGVLLLEIIAGKKNTGFYNTDSLNLLGYAWDLWTTGRGIELMDPVLHDGSVKEKMMLKYLNIAFLCVQENPADRPTMSDVVSMLGNDNIVLPFPKPHAFLNLRGVKNSSSAGTSTENVSVNAMTASVMDAR